MLYYSGLLLHGLCMERTIYRDGLDKKEGGKGMIALSKEKKGWVAEYSDGDGAFLAEKGLTLKTLTMFPKQMEGEQVLAVMKKL